MQKGVEIDPARGEAEFLRVLRASFVGDKLTAVLRVEEIGGHEGLECVFGFDLKVWNLCH